MLLALPFNINFLKLLYLYAGYYAICTAVLLFTLGVYGKLLRDTKIYPGIMIAAALLALGLGFQGMRGILVLYGPLFGIEIFRRFHCLLYKLKVDKTDIIITIWVIGLLFISYLGTLFPFSVGQQLSRNIRKGFNKLFTVVIPDMGKCVGIDRYNFIGKICVVLLLVLTMVMLINVLYRLLMSKNITPFEWCYVVVCSSPILTALIVSFTTADSADRYYFMLMFAMAFSVLLLWKKSHVGVKILLLGVIMILSVTNIYQIYIPAMKSAEPPETDAYRVVRFLEENECLTAYATFENANMMTVLSDGKVRVAPVASVSQMDICKWLSSEEWYPPNVPYQQKTAYIITEAEQEQFNIFLSDEAKSVEEVKQIGKFKIYISDFNYANLGAENVS